MSADVKSLVSLGRRLTHGFFLPHFAKQINHYARAGLFRHIQTVCDEVIKKRGKDPTLVFWKSYALAMEGSHAEAVRTLEAVASHRDIEFPATCALIHYHRSSRKVDRSAIGALEATLKSAEERSSPGSKILAATFYLHVEQHGRARAYIDKVLETNPDDVQALIVSGWIDLLLPRNSKRNIEKIHSSVEIFNRVLELSGTKKELEALMGKARYHMNKREYEAATESLNQAMVMYPWFVPALLEKAIILLMQDEYEGAVELCEKVLEQDPTNVQCLRLIPFMNLTREYNPSS
ncbi:ttc21b, partial [Symbiodinium sp. KB8]